MFERDEPFLMPRCLFYSRVSHPTFLYNSGMREKRQGLKFVQVREKKLHSHVMSRAVSIPFPKES